MTSTATEVRIRAAMFERRVAPVRARVNAHIGDVLAYMLPHLLRRRRKSKGWRKHVRRMKSKQRH